MLPPSDGPEILISPTFCPLRTTFILVPMAGSGLREKSTTTNRSSALTRAIFPATTLDGAELATTLVGCLGTSAFAPPGLVELQPARMKQMPNASRK